METITKNVSWTSVKSKKKECNAVWLQEIWQGAPLSVLLCVCVCVCVCVRRDSCYRRYITSIVSFNPHLCSKDQHLRILSRSILRLPRRLVPGDRTQKW